MLFLFVKCLIFLLLFLQFNELSNLSNYELIISILTLFLYTFFLKDKSTNKKLSAKDKAIIYLHALLPTILVLGGYSIYQNSYPTFLISLVSLYLIYAVVTLNEQFHIEPFQRDHIIASGPYTLIRHPIYAVNILLIVFALFYSHLHYSVLTSLAIYIPLTLARIKIEEDFLSKSQEYQQYKIKIPNKLIPYLY